MDETKAPAQTNAASNAIEGEIVLKGQEGGENERSSEAMSQAPEGGEDQTLTRSGRPAKRSKYGKRLGRKPGSKNGAASSRVTTYKTRQVLELAVKGLSAPMIAKAVDLPTRTVQSRLEQFKGVFTTLANVEDYQEVRGKLYEATEVRMLQSLMCEDTIAKASLNNRAYAFKQIHDARRLNAGQSTANTAHVHRYSNSLSDAE